MEPGTGFIVSDWLLLCSGPQNAFFMSLQTTEERVFFPKVKNPRNFWVTCLLLGPTTICEWAGQGLVPAVQDLIPDEGEGKRELAKEKEKQLLFNSTKIKESSRLIICLLYFHSTHWISFEVSRQIRCLALLFLGFIQRIRIEEVADSHFQDQAPASIIEHLLYVSAIKAVLLLFFVFVWFVLVMINKQNKV